MTRCVGLLSVVAFILTVSPLVMFVSIFGDRCPTDELTAVVDEIKTKYRL
jgi:hypothetical protein